MRSSDEPRAARPGGPGRRVPVAALMVRRVCVVAVDGGEAIEHSIDLRVRRGSEVASCAVAKVRPGKLRTQGLLRHRLALRRALLLDLELLSPRIVGPVAVVPAVRKALKESACCGIVDWLLHRWGLLASGCWSRAGWWQDVAQRRLRSRRGNRDWNSDGIGASEPQHDRERRVIADARVREGIEVTVRSRDGLEVG